MSIYDNRIAPKPKFEYYSGAEIIQHAGMYACYDTSYDQFMKAHCVKVEQYNEFIDIYLLEEENED